MTQNDKGNKKAQSFQILENYLPMTFTSKDMTHENILFGKR